ncbi:MULTISPECIES: RidA family protein [Pseudomonas]|uniref:RidA family protein n=1 Tax=Pseudomonas promysalinigenes TaxID=485898 RepID=A0ABY6ALK6_9PSED|nr:MULTISPECIES: RidA family protein [Pseudomonas]AUA33500.1 RidA family protein [Pseudomonas sp. SGAir0191]UXH38799.1 RidA family protein [Pseudomonas promysalinigenes]
MTSIQRFGVGKRASQLVVAGDRFDTAGLVALVPEGSNIVEQTRCVLNQLESLLAKIGANKINLARIQIWLADMADFEEMNSVYDNWVGLNPPVRACVGSQLASGDYRIEIQASGYL